MTEFDSKKKLKEAKIDYTWYNQQIEQKLPLLYKFLGICYKLDVYGDDNLIKNECAKVIIPLIVLSVFITSLICK